MAIDYREVDATAVQQQVLVNRAAEAERAAYAAETEVTRLQAVSSAAKTQADKDAVAALLVTAQDNATAARSAANRTNAGGHLTADQATEIHTNFLRSWVASLEQEHVAHVTIVQESNKDLAVTGTDALDTNKRAETEQAVTNSTGAIDIIESSWNVATKALDAAVGPATPTPQSPQPAASTNDPNPDTPNLV